MNDLLQVPANTGSPAPAGIDPTLSATTSAATGLPRTRGDRPVLARVLAGAVQAPPHPRG